MLLYSTLRIHFIQIYFFLFKNAAKPLPPPVFELLTAPLANTGLLDNVDPRAVMLLFRTFFDPAPPALIPEKMLEASPITDLKSTLPPEWLLLLLCEAVVGLAENMAGQVVASTSTGAGPLLTPTRLDRLLTPCLRASRACASCSG